MPARSSRLRLLGVAAAAVAATGLVTWLLEWALPPPYSGYLAVVVVGLVAIQLYKRQPEPQAQRWFRRYLAERARGRDEAAARARLLAGVRRRAGPEVAAQVEAAWRGPGEKERVVAAVGTLLAARGPQLDAARLGAVWDRLRDRFVIPGWESLPREFVDALRQALDPRQRAVLEDLVERYRLFEQRFFRHPSTLAADPAAAVADFARLLHSMGNRLRREGAVDAERAYRLSLELRPEGNLAHAGLALLLAETGRTSEAAEEARLALAVLDAYARGAGERPPGVEDIAPFRSPEELRRALVKLAEAG
jgi:hypothetical protein